MGQKRELGLIAGDPLLVEPARPEQRPEGEGVADTDVVFREHSRRLVHLAAAITLDRWLAEEVVQDAFAGLHANTADVDDPVGYLQRSVVNRSVSAIRDHRGRRVDLLHDHSRRVHHPPNQTGPAIQR